MKPWSESPRRLNHWIARRSPHYSLCANRDDPIVSVEHPKRKPAVLNRGNQCTMGPQFLEVEPMTWDGDDLAGQAEEVFERQQAAADARAHRGTSTVEERARRARFETLRQ